MTANKDIQLPNNKPNEMLKKLILVATVVSPRRQVYRGKHCHSRRYVMSEFRSEWGVLVVLRYVMKSQHLRPACHVVRS